MCFYFSHHEIRYREMTFDLHLQAMVRVRECNYHFQKMFVKVMGRVGRSICDALFVALVCEVL